MSASRGYPLTVCDERNRFNLIMPTLDADIILWCIGQYYTLKDATGCKHMFWQPNNKSNVQILLNSQDYGRLFKYLQSEKKCTIYIGEEAIRNYGLTISTYFGDFLDNVVLEKKENSCKKDSHEGPTGPERITSESAPDEQISSHLTANVLVPRETLDRFTEQLFKLEESLNDMELKQKSTALADKKLDQKICGTIDIPEDNPELVSFFTELKTVKQLENVFQRYRDYESLLAKCCAETERETTKDLLKEEIAVSKNAEVSERLDDRSLQVTVNFRDGSLYFHLYNNTNSVLAGNCKLKFTNDNDKPTTRIIEMGPHEIGIKEHKELRYFPYTPELITSSTIAIENEYEEVIFVGKHGRSPRVSLKPPSRLSVESLQASQDHFYDFRIDSLPELDDSSIISTSISLSCEDDDCGKAMTWEEL
ncbi:Atg19p SKDI_15G0770 [Saccharomyces kudriavzevii IFO 1802]|uniref:Autophagy protein Atg19/Atg34 C-terminal domain-containing protein n=1 Tax=Saccharomyces kudriavzevii (strain ATCC MYA-4449 / AS 2.2408 / CBS 8840 / NBRC 1802 / NCYC 2889) TaxID=226230 RepID=A0AA35J6R9_SACK1|nr:uncharacterized protein SKDI_15G0770 [Saccharomyces kudriavzevii IFO 1802]CAI4050867.1 hypothetical protein SKDI_15G0770 [Saccharomyces kudriavzevii IFO 1802]